MTDPIVVVPWSAAWAAEFARVAATIAAAFDTVPVSIEHVGSTAVPGLDAKPVIDVMLGAPALATIESRIAALAAAGFDRVDRHDAVMPGRRYFVRAACPDASPPRLRVHVHAVVEGSAFWREHLAFRDALRADASLVARYAALKRALAARHRDDREAYTDAKAPFIQAALAAVAHSSLAGGSPMTDVVSPARIAAGLTEYWSPRVVAEVDDSFVKVAKVRGEFAWHAHDDEDELFFILGGTLRIELEDRTVTLATGDTFVVPKGVRHRPVADEDCLVMLIERKSTLHTGREATAYTRSIADQLRPL